MPEICSGQFYEDIEKSLVVRFCKNVGHFYENCLQRAHHHMHMPLYAIRAVEYAFLFIIIAVTLLMQSGQTIKFLRSVK